MNAFFHVAICETRLDGTGDPSGMVARSLLVDWRRGESVLRVAALGLVELVEAAAHAPVRLLLQLVVEGEDHRVKVNAQACEIKVN